MVEGELRIVSVEVAGWTDSAELIVTTSITSDGS